MPGIYIQIYLLGTFLFCNDHSWNESFLNNQFWKYRMLTILTLALSMLNIILGSAFCIFVFIWSKGAATATVLSQMCSALWVLKFLTGKKQFST